MLRPAADDHAIAAAPSNPRAARAGPLHFPAVAGTPKRRSRDGEGWDKEVNERSLSEMSGGERQRLMLAQALLGEPRLLLLDEPLISLDYRYQETVIGLVRRFARDRNITVLFSAHELNQLMGALDRVLYLGNGHAALGTVAEVVTAPVLSRLYGADIDVVRADGHIFVLSRGREVDRADHLHDDDHHHHDHGHRHHA
jgi:zinc/manganese transport system ATP-binding protein